MKPFLDCLTALLISSVSFRPPVARTGAPGVAGMIAAFCKLSDAVLVVDVIRSQAGTRSDTVPPALASGICRICA